MASSNDEDFVEETDRSAGVSAERLDDFHFNPDLEEITKDEVDLEGVTQDEVLSTLNGSKSAKTKKGKKTSTYANAKKRTIVTSKADAKMNQGKSKKSTMPKKVPPKENATPRKKRTVSDDETPVVPMKDYMTTEKMNVAEENTVITIEDFITTIDTALSEQRIDEKKAERLHECLESGSWAEVAYTLLCEQIPLKRNGKGYSCRVCQVPKKGHTCMYCHVCSTPEDKYKKVDEHVCINCPTCFEFGKKNKKLIQVKVEGHKCHHA